MGWGFAGAAHPFISSANGRQIASNHAAFTRFSPGKPASNRHYVTEWLVIYINMAAFGMAASLCRNGHEWMYVWMNEWMNG